MGSITSIFFMAVEQEEIALPISDWMKDENIWKLFESTRDNKSQNMLFEIWGKHGLHFYDILKVVNRCNLESLNFLDIDILEDASGTILQSTELIPVIRSITIVIDELLNAVDNFDCMYNETKNNQDDTIEAFEDSEIYHSLNLDSYEGEGLFIILKTLLMVMTDALVNNKVFVYIKYTV